MKLLIAALALALTAGCVYQPIHIELYNVTDVSAESIDVGIDASRTTSNDLYEQVK